MNCFFEAIAYAGKIGYASDYYYNSLYKVDLENGKCEFINTFEEESAFLSRIHSAAKWIGDSVYFIPASGNYISIYHLADNFISTIPVPAVDMVMYPKYNPTYKFADAVIIENNLWLLPATFPGIVRLDINTKEIEIVNNWLEDESFFFRKAVFYYKDTIYLADGKSNRVLIYNTKEDKGCIKQIGEYNKGIMNLAFYAGRLWLAPKYIGAVVSWNLETDEIIEYKEFPTDFIPGRFAFTKCYAYDEKIYLIPNYANYGMVIDDTCMVKDVHTKWKAVADSFVEFLFETEENIYCREKVSEIENQVFIISKSDNKRYNTKFTIINKKEFDLAVILKKQEEKGLCKENAAIDLLSYIDVVDRNK